ncbi:unnamed protein product [Owenia fusiformis]|uniref:Protein-PII uridylyltransferase N-terminal domain-containing protein n=1 Tax=Owenia fusiformis TaxID=6347 RepID=A0A8S4NJC9_OWEFU|nr:unnamed protein product [Owenia fusiformis]
MGDTYKRRCINKSTEREHYVNATALYNAALVRLENAPEKGHNHQRYSKLIVTSCVQIETLYCDNILGGNIYCVKKGINQTKIDDLEKYRHHLKVRVKRLEKVWDKCPKPEDKRKPRFEHRKNQLTQLICKQNTKFVKEFSAELMEQSISVCGPPPCKITMVGLGSMARGESTPYSDLEYLFLTESDKHDEYFLNLHFHFLLQVLNLGQTPLPAMGIQSLNDFYNEKESNDFYDDVTPSGFKLDGNMPWASKTPPGHKATELKPPLKLIGTPTYMAELSTTEADKKHGYHLATIISTATRILGDENLFLDFQKQINTTRRGENPEFIRQICLERMHEDCQKYKFNFDDWSSKNVKKDYYRFPSTFINNMKDLHMLDVTSPWEIIRELQRQSILTSEQCSHLYFMINVAIGIRLLTYCTKNQQHESIIELNPYHQENNAYCMDSLSPSKVLRECLRIPHIRLMQSYLLRLQSINYCIKSGMATKPSSMIMYCQCKVCILQVKIKTCIGPDDIIYEPEEMIESLEQSWHVLAGNIRQNNCYDLAQFCRIVKGDLKSAHILMNKKPIQTNNMTNNLTTQDMFAAISNLKMGNDSAALQQTDAAIKVCPPNIPGLLLYLKYIKLHCHSRLQDYHSVVLCFEDMTKLKPYNNLPEYERAYVGKLYTDALINIGDNKTALEYLPKLKEDYAELFGETSEEYKQTLERLLTCYMVLGRIQEAEKVQNMLKRTK